MAKRHLFRLTQALFAAALAAGSAGCMQMDPDTTGEIEISTHVTDWREEIIYQVLIDRFADGDAGNNFRVDYTAPAHWHGGDWKGLEDKLDYIESLGVTTLWISPVVKNVDTDAGFDGYHGYWAQDMTEVNPHFGDLGALRSMVAAAHGRDMKVILDIVTNHVGQAFYYDINKNGQPDKDPFGGGKPGQSPVTNITEYDPEFDPRGIQAFTSLGESGPAPVIFQYDPPTNHVPPWPELFRDTRIYNKKGRTWNYDDLDQLVHGDFPGGLKDVDTARCDVKRTMVDVYARWVELADFDGLRIDTVKHVEHEFWRFFTQKVRQRLRDKGKTNFFMFGEAFSGDDVLIGSFTKQVVPAHQNDTDLGGDLTRENASEDEGGCPSDVPITADALDGVFYFSQYYTAMRNVFRDAQGTAQIAQLWDQRAMNYGTTPNADGTGLPPAQTLVNFLDNHDVNRFLYHGGGVSQFPGDPLAHLHNALVFLLTIDGIPCIYYGTEQAFDGGNDPANREDMWGSGYAEDGATFKWTQRLTKIRRKVPALMKGNQTVVWATDRTADEEDAGVFAFERAGGDAGDSYALVVFNTNADKTSQTAFEGSEMTVSAAAGTSLVDVLSPEQAVFQVGAGGALTVSLPPLSAMILVPQDQAPQDL